MAGETETGAPCPQGITVLADDGGYLLLGDSSEIDRALAGRELASRKLDPKTISKIARGIMEAANHSAQSGKWVKLTKESTEALAKYGKTGMQSGVLRGADGKMLQHLKFVNPGELANPAMAAGLGGMMAQYALDQAIEEITNYLKAIDGKLDDLLQDQKDRMAAELGGAALAVDEAYAIRSQVGSVNEVTWSKVATCGQTVASAQHYVLSKLNGLASKLESDTSSEDLIELAKKTPSDVSDWLKLLAWAIKVEDQLSVIELDRVMALDPDGVEQHRMGIRTARWARLESIERELNRLSVRMGQASERIGEDRLRLVREIPLFERESDRALAALRSSSDMFQTFASTLDLHIETHAIESAPEWGEVAGELASEVADSARELGGVVADRAQDLGGQATAALKGLGGALQTIFPFGERGSKRS